MNRRLIAFAVPAILAAALGARTLTTHRPAAPAAVAAQATSASPRTAPRAAAPEAPAARARYRITAAHSAFVNDRPAASVALAGTWTMTERAGGRVELELAPARLDVTGDAPPATGDVSAPFVAVRRDGVLAGLAFPEAMPGKARDLLAGLATALQVTVQPGDAWTVEEEDLTGRYEAVYARRGDTITRARGRYTRRGARGADTLASDEASAFTFDARGLASAQVKLEQRTALGKGMPDVRMRLTITLVREDVSTVALAAGPDLAPEAIAPHVDRAAAARGRDLELVGKAEATALIGAARTAAHAEGPGSDQQRSAALRKLSALARLDPGAADDLTAAVRAEPGDRASVKLLAGALGSAGTAEATSALASLLSSPLPDDARSTVLANLALTKAPTAESVAALASALDGPLGSQAALALGAQAGKLGDEGAGAVDALVTRYRSAATPEDRAAMLEALANTGSREALPLMLEAIAGDDFHLAGIGAYGLRLIPGDDVDDALWSLIGTGSPVLFQALSAVGYRAPALWAPRLTAAKAAFADQKRVVEAIQAVLTRWSHVAVANAE